MKTYYPRWTFFPSVCLAILLVSILLTAFIDVPVRPPDWRTKYSDQDDIPCCGENDCVRAEIAVLTEQFPFPEQVLIEVSRYQNKAGQWVDHKGPPILVNSKGVHLSEDEYAYFCHYENEWNEFEMDDQETKVCWTNTTITISRDCMRCVFLNYGT